MGFFSKVWGGFKKAVKSIGKGIKKVAKGFGKFMGKIGIVGQIALMFILPGIGAAIGAAYSAAAGAAAASATGWVATAGKILTTVGKFASTVGNVYKTVTNGISHFISKVGGSMVNKAGSLIGLDKPLLANAPTSVSKGFSSWMEGIGDDVNNITSPFAKTATEVTKEVVETPYEKSLTAGLEEPTVTAPTVAAPTTPKVGGVSDVTNVLDVNTDYTAPTMAESAAANQDMVFTSDLQDSYAQGIVKAETSAKTSLASKAADYAQKTLGTAVDTGAKTFASAAAQGLATKTGVVPEPEYNTTYTTISPPEFNSTPLNMMYETAGLSYGALPNNRVEFYAGSQQAGDFGRTSYSNFTQFRPA